MTDEMPAVIYVAKKGEGNAEWGREVDLDWEFTEKYHHDSVVQAKDKKKAETEKARDRLAYLLGQRDEWIAERDKLIDDLRKKLKMAVHAACYFKATSECYGRELERIDSEGHRVTCLPDWEEDNEWGAEVEQLRIEQLRKGERDE